MHMPLVAQPFRRTRIPPITDDEVITQAVYQQPHQLSAGSGQGCCGISLIKAHPCQQKPANEQKKRGCVQDGYVQRASPLLSEQRWKHSCKVPSDADRDLKSLHYFNASMLWQGAELLDKLHIARTAWAIIGR
jgi:hypothetical protein